MAKEAENRKDRKETGREQLANRRNEQAQQQCCQNKKNDREDRVKPL